MRFTFSTVTWRDADRAFIAGKKMKDDRGEKVAAKVMRKTVNRFCGLVNCE